jgi:phage FluMu gp28-like protein
MTLASYEGQDIVFDEWQISHLHNYARLRAVEKAPQIGFSWLSACEAVWKALLFDDADSGFVSSDLREAQNKVLYARKLYDGLPDFVQRWVPMDGSTEELRFGAYARPSRLTSFPNSSGLRGRSMDVYLDEADFYLDGGQEAFRAGLTRITRGRHLRLTMGSTVFGSGTKLDSVMRGNDDTRFSRAILPWQVVEDPDRRGEIEEFMAELPEEEAREEYECIRGGGALDTFSPALIRRQLSVYEPVSSVEWRPTGPAVAGFDVGKSRHPSILIGLEKRGSSWHPAVIEQPTDSSGSPLSLPEQERYLTRIMEDIPTLTLAVDVAGLGQQINDALSQRFGSRFIAINSSSKPADMPPMGRYELATEVKRALEADEGKLPNDRELMAQFKQTRLESNGKVTQPGSKRSTHFDRFWTYCYAWYATHARNAVRSRYADRGLVVVGGELGGGTWRRLGD